MCVLVLSLTMLYEKFLILRRIEQDMIINIRKGKGKGHPITGHEGPEREQRYSSTLSLTSALDGVGGQRHAPAALSPGERPGNHCVGGWVGPRAGLDGCGMSRTHRDSIPGPPSSQRVAIPTGLTPPTTINIYWGFIKVAFFLVRC